MLDLSKLNEAQLQAVTAPEGPQLVIAGAGSGKTRTIVYRLAWLVEQGYPAEKILLLTFTRKAAREMQNRASQLLEQSLLGIQGGTFHSFAYSVIRRHPPAWANYSLCVMDSADSSQAIQHCREQLQIARGDRSFPRTAAIIGLFSKARNKEARVSALLQQEAPHLLPHAEDLEKLEMAYAAYRKEHGLLDYDDLLFELETMLLNDQDQLSYLRSKYRWLLVDEYQDTNKVQARLMRLLVGDTSAGGGNIMAVGDDAQSIYAFRGATVRNILDFPDHFPGTRIVRLEENYRSVQPILNVANALLANAPQAFHKRLFSRRDSADTAAVRIHHPLSDLSQSRMVAQRVEQLLETARPTEIAVLFRASYQSYQLEVELNKRNIPFRKYGGLRYTEASHIKDVLAFARLLINPFDLPSFERIAALSKGVGPKTATRLFELVTQGKTAELQKAAKRFPDFLEHMALLDSLRGLRLMPVDILNNILGLYRPVLERNYPEDWPRRLNGLDELTGMAASYQDLALFIADLSLENTEDDEYADEQSRIVLSTVHSAKGLEWSAVMILDLVEDRFPSRHALARPEEFEEERRLLYVACTRAKDSLDLYVPMTVFNRVSGGQEPVAPSPFIQELPLADLEEIFENYGGGLARRHSYNVARQNSQFSPDPAFMPKPLTKVEANIPDLADAAEPNPAPAPVKLGYCRHKLFGRGKIVEIIPPNKYRVNFPGMGLKVIMADYLTLENQ